MMTTGLVQASLRQARVTRLRSHIRSFQTPYEIAARLRVYRDVRSSGTSVVERPAASERFVDSNQADHRVPLALNELVLRRIDGALCIEDGEKVLQTARVTVHGELQGPVIRRHRDPERPPAPH